MARKKKRELCLGAFLVAGGCLVRSIQLVGAYFGAGFVSLRWLYVTMLCLLCGGFAVLAYEKKGKASFFAIASSAVSLLSTVMGNMSSGDDLLRILSAVFLVATFALVGLYCVFASEDDTLKKVCGVTVILLAVACGIFAAGLTVSPVITLIVLLAAYVLTGLAVLM